MRFLILRDFSDCLFRPALFAMLFLLPFPVMHVSKHVQLTHHAKLRLSRPLQSTSILATFSIRPPAASSGQSCTPPSSDSLDRIGSEKRRQGYGSTVSCIAQIILAPDWWRWLLRLHVQHSDAQLETTASSG